MFGHSFYHGALRKYIIMFGNMFNDLEVGRYNTSGQLIQSIKVPISYGPKEKFLARLREDPGLDREFATVLPRLSFEITNISYDATRSYNKMNRMINLTSGGDMMKTQHTPSPYDIDITLYGMFANNEDAVQVVEQILPFFRPEWTHSVKITSDMGAYFDVPTVLNDMSIEDTYEGDFQTRRAIIYTFNFTIKGYMFGPVQNKGVIKRTKITAISMDHTAADRYSRVTTTPGLDANGNPVTLSNKSIPISQIDANSNYGYAFDIENYFDIIDRRVEVGEGEAPAPDVGFTGPQRFALSAAPLVAEEGDNLLGTEGDVITFTLTALNVNDRTRIPWTITGISSSDILRNTTGYFTVLDQKATINIQVNKDYLTEETEYLTMSLDNGEANVTIQIDDTSYDRKYFFSTDKTSVNTWENETITFSLTTQNVFYGQTLQIVSDNWPVANLNGSVGAISTASGNNEIVTSLNGSNVQMTIPTNFRTSSGETEAKFYLKGVNADQNEANVSIIINDPGFPFISMGDQQNVMSTANIAQTVETVNTYDLEPIVYRIDSILEDIPSQVFGMPVTGTIYANNSTNESTLNIIPGNTSIDYLDRYFEIDYRINYGQLTDANTAILNNQVATSSQTVKYNNQTRPAGASAYSIIMTQANNYLLQTFGYDMNKVSSPFDSMNIDGIYETIEMSANSSILYAQVDTSNVNIYISRNNDWSVNNAITNTEIVVNNGANTGQIIFAPKEVGTYYYWNTSNTESYGTINVYSGNNSVNLPIIPE